MDLAMSAISSFWKLLLTIRRGFYYNNSKYIWVSVIIFGVLGLRPAASITGKNPEQAGAGCVFLFCVRLAAHVSNRCKSGIRPVVGRI